MRKRIKWVDIAKAIGIFVIALGHTVGEGPLKTYVYSFHIPLFFFLSGATFHVKEKSFREFIKGKVLGLLVPYTVFALISQLVYIIIHRAAANLIGSTRNFTIVESWSGILLGNVEANRGLWFLPCLFLMSLALYPIIRNLEKGTPCSKAIAVGTIATSVIFTFLDEYIFHLGSLPWKLDAALKMLSFSLGGWFFAHNADRIPIRMTGLRICPLALLAIGCVSGIFWNSRIQYLGAVYGNVPVFYLSSISSVLGICLLLMPVKGCTWLERIGRSTLAILVMHKFPIMFFEWVCPVVKNWMAAGLLVAELPVVIISIAMCCLAERIILKICPFMLGRFSRS